jgi:hypothetical protein
MIGMIRKVRSGSMNPDKMPLLMLLGSIMLLAAVYVLVFILTLTAAAVDAVRKVYEFLFS